MKVAVTGSSRGIGLFLADSLGERGHEVWRIARSAQPAPSTRCDVSEWSQISACASEVAARWGELDALICCAGIQRPIGPSMEVDPGEWQRNLAVNLNGQFFAIRAFYPLLLRASRRGKILCFSGGGASGPRPFLSAYASAKTAVVRLVETLSAEWAGEPPDINAVAPGAIFTGMTEEILEAGAGLAGTGEIEAAARAPKDNSGPLADLLGLVETLLSERGDGVSGKLVSARWDPWHLLPDTREQWMGPEVYTLRRVVPECGEKRRP